MTGDRARKRAIRARMAAAGEPYSVAARNPAVAPSPFGGKRTFLLPTGHSTDGPDMLELMDRATSTKDAGDLPGAETLARRTAAAGDTQALHALADARERAGDHDSARDLHDVAALYDRRRHAPRA